MTVYVGDDQRQVVDRSCIVGTDDVSLSGGSASFATAAAADGKTVTGTGFTLSGAQAGNYMLDSTTLTTTADITRKPLTGSFTADDKVYDGTAVATVASKSLPGVETGDDVALVVTSPHFDNRNVGTAKDVTGALSLSGTDANNYTVNASHTAKADITRKPITVTADDKTKVYGRLIRR